MAAPLELACESHDDSFEPAYAQNCMVNAMCVGVLPADRLQSAGADGPGNLVVLYGSKTGREGIGGALR